MEEKKKEQVKEEIFKSIVDSMAYEAKNGKNITLRLGDAPKLQNPTPVAVTGIIDSPLRWLEKRHDVIDLKACNIQVDRDEMKICLDINERDYYNDYICGQLLLSEEYKRFGINQGKYITGLEISDLIRMNRTCFESKSKAMELVTVMRNFKAKVLKEIENSDDKKGNVAQVRRQTVEGNQPPSFDLCIPIFKGQPKQKFTVEIDIDPDTLLATLVSPDAQDLIAETRDSLVDGVLSQIQEICPEIPIIEV